MKHAFSAAKLTVTLFVVSLMAPVAALGQPSPNLESQTARKACCDKQGGQWVLHPDGSKDAKGVRKGTCQLWNASRVPAFHQCMLNGGK